MQLIELQRDFGTWLRSGETAIAERLGGGAGFPVYLNNYRASLMASLSASFERTEQWIGSDAFATVAAHHIDTHPPHHWTLDAYGQSFPDQLQAFYPDDPEVADIARLEWILGTVFIAPDGEPLRADAIASVDWDKAVLRLVPSATLLSLSTNADEIVGALLEGADEPPDILPAAASLLIWCRAFTPLFRRMDEEELDFIQRLANGLSFAGLCAELSDAYGAEAGINKAGTLLAQWATEGIICLGGSEAPA